MHDIQKEISVLMENALDTKLIENYRKPGFGALGASVVSKLSLVTSDIYKTLDS